MRSRESIVKEIGDYFKSPHWQGIIKLWKNPDEPVYHAHAFVDNQVDYRCLQPIVEANLEANGLILDREIDHVGPGPGRAALHGIHPGSRGFMPLVDWFWKYSSDVVLKPMDPAQGEGGKNLIWWGKSYMDEWFKQFEFKCVGPYEEEEILNWIKNSRQWKKMVYLLENMEKEGISHFHTNTEINFDPKVFDIFARQAMKEIGWTICNATPCVYKVGNEYRGKITYSLAHPEEVFDISWKFNPDVVIRPSTETFVFTDDPEFDIWTVKMFDDTAVRGGEYIKLSDVEIQAVIDSFK
ncbi:MAG: hypothetical protein HPY71_15795 [Firmicutes bacterium]|nr:hypothetical protein [Bacillota bacterium]